MTKQKPYRNAAGRIVMPSPGATEVEGEWEHDELSDDELKTAPVPPSTDTSPLEGEAEPDAETVHSEEDTGATSE